MTNGSAVTKDDTNDTMAFVDSVTMYSSVVLTALSAIAFFVNLYLLNCSQYLRRPIGVNLRLCVSLTASDALCAFFYILTYVVNSIVPGLVSTCWSLLIEVCKYSTFFASVFTLLALALNHYVGIVYPLRRHAITPRTVRFAIGAAYLVPLTFFLAIFSIRTDAFRADESFAFFSENGCTNATIFRTSSYRWTVVLPFILIILILSFLYGHILVHMGRISRDPLLSHNINNRKRKSNRKLLVTLVLLAGSACLGWLPTMISFVFTCHTCIFPIQSLLTRALLGAFAQAIHISKLLLDAFVYASRLIEIRYSMYVFDEVVRKRIRAICGKNAENAPLPSEFSRYLSETKEHRSTRRKHNASQFRNTASSSPKNLQLEPCISKRASSVVMTSSGRTASSLSPISPHGKLHKTRSCKGTSS